MIEVNQVTKTYKMGEIEVQALRGVSFQVHDGEMIAIMGPSGSGKSTLMNVLGALDKPTSGSYRLDGIEEQLRSIATRLDALEKSASPAPPRTRRASSTGSRSGGKAAAGGGSATPAG